jgi:hypothetical protein
VHGKRSYVLISALAIAFAGMVAFMSWQYNMPMREMGGYILFGILLVVIAIVSAFRPNLIKSTALRGRWPRQVFGAFALAFASWMLGSVLLLPVIGFAGFELVERRPWFGIGFLMLTAALIPVTRRFM